MKILRRLLYFTLTVIGIVLKPLIKVVFSLIYSKDEQVVSPVKNKLCLKSVAELAQMIRKREVKAVEVMEAFISRTKEVNPLLNFVVADCFDQAVREAEEVDRVLDSENIEEKFSEENAPLLGVPLSVKEAFALKGMPNTSGLVSRKGKTVSYDATVVSRLKKAGAIPYMVTNVSELCMWYESANRLNGRTRNPYNTSRIVGGSSGGEGCAIGSGAAVIGIGSDIGGSIRMPAFFNGIFGHRPSKGLVPNDGQFPIPTGNDMDLLSTGPLCRYAADLLPLLKIYAGSKSAQAKLDDTVDLRSLKYYTMYDDGGSLLVSPVDSQLRAAHQRVVSHFRKDVGVQVEEVNLSKLKYSVEIWSAKMTTSGGTAFADYMGDGKGTVNCFKELLKWLIGKSPHTLPAIGLGLGEKLSKLTESTDHIFLKMAEKLDQELRDLLDNGVLLYPSHPKIAPYHNEPILYPFNFAYTGIFNALGYPVTQCPLGLSKEKLPLGIQVVSAMNNDRLTIAVAQEIEAAFGGWVNPGTI